MALVQLVYASQPFGFDEAMLNGILSDARRMNAASGVTGALICRADVYLQLIEGEAEAIAATFARIKRDNRHNDIEVLFEGAVERRRFPAWAMRDDPARSWLWSQADVAQGALRRATTEDLWAVFDRLAADVPAMGATD